MPAPGTRGWHGGWHIPNRPQCGRRRGRERVHAGQAALIDIPTVVEAVINQHDEVRQVLAHFRSVPVWDVETEIVVFDVGAHARMRLRDAAKLGFPIAIEDYPVDVTTAGICLPAMRFGGIKIDVTC